MTAWGEYLGQAALLSVGEEQPRHLVTADTRQPMQLHLFAHADLWCTVRDGHVFEIMSVRQHLVIRQPNDEPAPSRSTTSSRYARERMTWPAFFAEQPGLYHSTVMVLLVFSIFGMFGLMFVGAGLEALGKGGSTRGQWHFRPPVQRHFSSRVSLFLSCATSDRPPASRDPT